MADDMNDGGNNERPEADANAEPEWFKLIRQQIASLNYGTVQITVHASRVVQVARSGNDRLDFVSSAKPQAS